MHRERLEPKSVSVFLREGYSWALFAQDLVAGILVGIVAVPLSIALGIASGVKPEQGLYTAVIAGFLISLLSGSRVQIGGPTGAFIVLVYNTIQKYGYDGLAVATMLAGALLVLMGLLRFGAVIKFIPYPLTVGFTCGIAVLIAATQIRDLFGLSMPPPPAEFIEKLIAYYEHIDTLNWYAVGVAAFAFAIIYLWPRVTRKIPGSLIAILLITPLVHILHIPVETIGSRFGSVPNSLPAPQLPAISFRDVTNYFQPALAIALLAGIESLLSAVVADGMTGRRHRSNTELVAQGVANLISPLFSGIPATGAIARTATNIRNGGKTPMAGMIHALTVLAIMLVFGPQAALIPMPVLAAILLKVSIDMGEWHLLARLLKAPRGDVVVMLSTLLLTIFVDLTIAIESGVVLASFLFLHRMMESTQITAVSSSLSEVDEDDGDIENASTRAQIPKGAIYYEIYGPFFFGAADRFTEEIRRIREMPAVLILGMPHVPFIDATGLRALEELFATCTRTKTTLILAGVQDQPWDQLVASGLYQRIGPQNVHSTLGRAVQRAKELLPS